MAEANKWCYTCKKTMKHTLGTPYKVGDDTYVDATCNECKETRSIRLNK